MRFMEDFLYNTFEFKVQNLNKKANQCCFSGYASVFNVVDCQNDIVTQNTFCDSMKDRVIPLLWQHDLCSPIGKVIEMKQDSKGLYIVASLCMAVQRAQEVFALLKEGIISGLSVGYSPTDCEFEQDFKSNKKVRRIKKATLWEVSLVTFPANRHAKITNLHNLHNLQTHLENNESLEVNPKSENEIERQNFLEEEKIFKELLGYMQ